MFRAIALLSVSGALWGCLGETPSNCSSPEDCEGTQICASGVCVRPGPAPDLGAGGAGGAGAAGGGGGSGGAGGALECEPGTLDLDGVANNGCEVGCTLVDEPFAVVEEPVALAAVNWLGDLAYVLASDNRLVHLSSMELYTQRFDEPVRELALTAAGEQALVLTLNGDQRATHAQAWTPDVDPVQVDAPSVANVDLTRATLANLAGAAVPIALGGVYGLLVATVALPNGNFLAAAAGAVPGQPAVDFEFLMNEARAPLEVAGVPSVVRSSIEGVLRVFMLIHEQDNNQTWILPVRSEPGMTPVTGAPVVVEGLITQHAATDRLYVARLAGGVSAWFLNDDMPGFRDDPGRMTLDAMTHLAGVVEGDSGTHYVFGLNGNTPVLTVLTAEGEDRTIDLLNVPVAASKLWMAGDIGTASLAWVPRVGGKLMTADLDCK